MVLTERHRNPLLRWRSGASTARNPDAAAAPHRYGRAMDWTLRPGTLDDIEAMQSVEVDAGARFRDVGLDAIADDEPPDADTLAAHVADATIWVSDRCSLDGFFKTGLFGNAADHAAKAGRVLCQQSLSTCDVS